MTPDSRAAPDSELPFRTQEKLRFADQDMQGHVNNAVYSTLFECSRVEFQAVQKCLVLAPGQTIVAAAIAIDFLRELHWPATVELRLGVTRIGRSSFAFAQEVWRGETRHARAQSTQVIMDERTRRPVPLSAAQRQQLSKWLIG